MAPEHLKERSLFDRDQCFVLLPERELRECSKQCNPGAIDFTRSLLALISMFWDRFDVGAFGIAILVAAIGSGELAIYINDDTGFCRARPAGVARENTRAGGHDHASLDGCEESKRNGDVAVLRLKPYRFTREGVE